MSSTESPTLTALRHDQAQLATADNRIRLWAATHPCLSGARTAADLVALIQGRHDTPHSTRGRMQCDNRVLYAMLTLAAHDPEAGRVILHAMQPLIVTSARRTTASYPSYDDALSAAVASMWETICAFPLHRAPHKALANLRGDFLKRLCGKWASPEVEDARPTDPALLSHTTSGQEDVELAAVTGLDSPIDQMSGLELLALGVDAGAITHDEAGLLMHLYIDGLDADRVADRMGISQPALRQRKSRALRRLGTWAQQTH